MEARNSLPYFDFSFLYNCFLFKEKTILHTKTSAPRQNTAKLATATTFRDEKDGRQSKGSKEKKEPQLKTLQGSPKPT